MDTIEALERKLKEAKSQRAVEATYPTGIVVDLSSPQGNAFYIIGLCQEIGRKLNIPQQEIDKFIKECKNKDYSNLLQATQKMFGLIFIGK
ncbi:MAG: hypothetical protein R3Y43_01350 [Alphaproteobacteria bacterium]